ncbi:MAG: 2-oxoglutarate dehydrogenase, E2 component, dihydrolipoamide succinyltransferase, partial [Pseudonocardiaceae bacterium]|nr:2-oxoglutarate dehydrogenase, E2 component, dihydrolipoamide succinyltransferase [Pseudonocardiaceae bacterium]
GAASAGSSEQAPAEQPAQQAERQAQQAPAEQQPAQPEPAAATPAPPEPESAPAQAAPAPSSGGGGAGTPVTMPALGESVTEGTVTRWLKQVGDTVAVDEPLLEVSTDKVDTEIPSPVAGTLLEIVASEDETVEVGGQLAMVGDSMVGGSSAAPAQAAPAPSPEPGPAPQPAPQPESAPKHATQEQPAPQAQQPPQAQTAPAQPAQPAQPQQPAPPQPSAPPAEADESASGAPYVTPLVRKLAGEHGIDLNTIKGSGVGGRIRKQDVLAAVEAKQQPARPEPAAAAAPAQAAAPAPAAPSAEAQSLRGTTQKLSRLRQVVAQRTRESLAISAQLTQLFEVDVTKIARMRDRAKTGFEQREGVKLTFLPFFAKATVEALKQHPKLNASINEEAKEVTYYGAEHLGIAIDTERGLVNAVVHNAGELNIAGLAHKINDLATRTRNNQIKPDELAGGTFSLTNLGSNGALSDTPILVQPQVGILGVGSVVKRPVVMSDTNGDDTIAIRSMAYLALTYDHRLVDGADAGRFLTTIKNRLQEGRFEADLGL